MFRTRRCNRDHADAGFTLIEVLVALGVLAVTLAAIGSLIASTVRSTRAIDTHVTLVETGRAIETGLPERDRLALGNFSGEVRDHRWRVDVLPFFAPNVDQRQLTPWVPQRIVIKVQSPTGAALQIDTIRLRRREAGR